MNIRMSFDRDSIDWDELLRLFNIVKLGNKTLDKLELTFNNSRFICFIYDNERLIGAGRALADGAYCSYICDIGVHPDYQGHGFGKKIVQNLIEQSKNHKMIILYANPGKEDFYSKLGFKYMNTAMAIFANEEEALKNGFIRTD